MARSISCLRHSEDLPNAKLIMHRTGSERVNTDPLTKLRDYTWGYFSLHADQRLKTFNFFVVLCVALTAGILAIVREAKDPAVASPLAFLMTFLSFVFWKLDQRCRQLIQHAETALKFIEDKAYLPESDIAPHPLKLVTGEEEITNGLKRFPAGTLNIFSAHFSYQTCFEWVFFVLGVGGAIVGCVLLYMQYAKPM